HQIRIHLAELGHPVCGDKVYHHRPDGTVEPDTSGAPRLALHAAELGFVHPVTGQPVHWMMPLPDDLQAFLQRLRGPAAEASPMRSTTAVERPRPVKKRRQRKANDGD